MGSSDSLPFSAAESVSPEGMTPTEFNLVPGAQGGEVSSGSRAADILKMFATSLASLGKGKKSGLLPTPQALSSSGIPGLTQLKPLDFSQALSSLLANIGSSSKTKGGR